MNEPAIRALIAKWRDAAVWEHDDMSNVQAAQTFDQCAYELEALLADEEDQPPTGKIPTDMPD